ncbi:TRM-domain-containing protein [Apiospora phragmitis]|uniref:TRM-domain-containing protein n=1 Tax=Apiospora phragmitis TaxID=2905665 RepID=A0ABR1T9T5_9PEZI
MGRTSHVALSGHGSNKAADDSNSSFSPVSLGESSIICIKPRGVLYDILSLKEETSSDDSVSFRLSHQSATDVPKSLLDKFLVEEAPEHLRAADNRKVHLVVSTSSGMGLALDFYNSVLQPLLGGFGLSAAVPGDDGDGKSSSLNLVTTRDAQSIREFAASLPLGVEHTVVLMSGDGGIMESLNGKATVDDDDEDGPAMVRLRPLPLIAMLPLGTGNALFNSLHKGVYAACEAESAAPSPLALGLRTLLRGRRAPLPSFRVDFSPGSWQISYRGAVATVPGAAVEEQLSPVTHLYGAIVASYGFHAQLVWESDTPAYRKHGAKRFGMVAAELLKESHAYHARVERKLLLPPSSEAGQQPQPIGRQDRHAYVLATLVSNLERTFTISPASRPLDGALRLVHFGPVGGERTMEIMTQAYNDGQHVGMNWKRATTAAADENGGEDKGKEEEEEEEEEEGVAYEQVGEVRVVTHEADARWRKVCVDGTIVELPLEGSMTVRTESAPHLEILVDPSVSTAATTGFLNQVQGRRPVAGISSTFLA